jgi:hypothetical protein
MSDNNPYNGYNTYEAWCVSLWLNNDEGTHRFWLTEAEQVRAAAKECPPVKDGIWTPAQAEQFLLADRLKNHLNDQSPLTEPSLYSDLLNAALAAVEWPEVADEFLEGLGPIPEAAAGSTEPQEPRRKPPSGEAKFALGQVVATPGALAQLSPADRLTALARHARGDWGDVCEEDWQENEFALGQYLRLFSVYHTPAGQKFWLITEADRSVTTLLLPAEY